MDEFADLHNHTTNSDGLGDTDELISEARECGLQAIAITDHDVLPESDVPMEHVDGLDVIYGIELRVEPVNLDGRVDLLGYGVQPTDELEEILSQIQDHRIRRARDMLQLIQAEERVVLDMDVTATTGRPHIARAIAESDELDYEYSEAFEELIGSGCSCYIQRDGVPSFEKGVEALDGACEFISLAHPYRYEDSQEALKLSKDLDGVECKYPYSGSERDYVRRLDTVAVDWFDLTQTGGSDTHELDEICRATLSKDEYEDFLMASGLEEYSGLF